MYKVSRNVFAILMSKFSDPDRCRSEDLRNDQKNDPKNIRKCMALVLLEIDGNG